MRTTVNIDDELMKAAQKLTGIEEKASLLRAGLKALIEQESARRLAALGGSEPQLTNASRRRAADA
ncbi:MAG: type II toxin-antitoxin system VapB family antitoxin [Lysobacterales bacterium]